MMLSAISVVWASLNLLTIDDLLCMVQPLNCPGFRRSFFLVTA
jgi:hypothetical protein